MITNASHWYTSSQALSNEIAIVPQQFCFLDSIRCHVQEERYSPKRILEEWGQSIGIFFLEYVFREQDPRHAVEQPTEQGKNLRAFYPMHPSINDIGYHQAQRLSLQAPLGSFPGYMFWEDMGSGAAREPFSLTGQRRTPDQLLARSDTYLSSPSRLAVETHIPDLPFNFA